MTENNGYIAIMVICGLDKCTSLLENSHYYKDDKAYLSKYKKVNIKQKCLHGNKQEMSNQFQI